MRTLLLPLILMLSFSVSANDVDLKATMQDMKLAFKQSAEATSIEEMKSSVIKLDSLIGKLKQGEYPPEKQSLYQEGFEKLSKSLESVKAEVESGNLEQAQQELRQIDQLRVEYHDKRNPSIWSRFFS